MSYLSLANFQADSAGVDLSQILDPELQSVLNRASTLCDVLTNNDWSYHIWTNESHDLNTGEQVSWETYAYHTPVRIITKAFVSNSLNISDSDFYRFNITTGAAPGPSDIPAGQLPTNFGGIFLDRDRDIIMINFTALQFGLAGQVFPFTSFKHPGIFITYSGGYDDGTIQSDGYSLPAPSWLQESTRLIASAMVFERGLAAQGLSGMQSVKQGTDEFTRMASNSKDGGFSFPAEVAEMLRQHRKTSMA